MPTQGQLKASLKRIRAILKAFNIYYYFYINGKSINSIISAVTPKGDLSHKQLNTAASQALQANVLPPVSTPQPSIDLACRVTPKTRAMAQRLIQSTKKPGITPEVQDSAIQRAILLLYSGGFCAKEVQVAYIKKLIYNRTNIVLII